MIKYYRFILEIDLNIKKYCSYTYIENITRVNQKSTCELLFDAVALTRHRSLSNNEIFSCALCSRMEEPIARSVLAIKCHPIEIRTYI